MTRSRRRSRPRGAALAVAVAVLLVVAGAHGTGAYTTGHVDRTSTVNVTSDGTAALGLDTATAVHTNRTERLVTVTNRLDRDVSVTVALRSSSVDAADLVLDGANEGDRLTVSIGKGASQRIDVAVADDSSLVGQTVDFDTEATATGLHVTADDRRAPIES